MRKNKPPKNPSPPLSAEPLSIHDLRKRFHVGDSGWIVTVTKHGRLNAHPMTKTGEHNARRTVETGGSVLRRCNGMSRKNAIAIVRRRGGL